MSLQDLFTSGYTATYVPLASWHTLMDANTGWQPNCNRQGFNAQVDGGKSIRLGLFMNEQGDCNSCDSAIGIGANSWSAERTPKAKCRTSKVVHIVEANHN